MTAVNQVEFAKLLGCNKSHVTRLKQKGMLVMTEGGLVDVEASKKLIAANSDTTVDNNSKGADEPKAGDVSYNTARARNEHAKAQMAELELAVKLGQLVDADEARLFAADLGATVRGALEILPDRLAPELVPLNDTEAIRAVLVESFEQVLVDLADKMAKWGTA